MKDNSIDIEHLKRADLTVGDVKAIITVLEAVTTGLILPDEANAALERLKRSIGK
jgi:hypothetical protein